MKRIAILGFFAAFTAMSMGSFAEGPPKQKTAHFEATSVNYDAVAMQIAIVALPVMHIDVMVQTETAATTAISPKTMESDVASNPLIDERLWRPGYCTEVNHSTDNIKRAGTPILPDIDKPVNRPKPKTPTGSSPQESWPVC